jgi:hypothetical protein
VLFVVNPAGVQQDAGGESSGEDNLRALAAKHQLMMTGGTDYHGFPTDVPIGSVMPPPGCVQELRERAAKYPIKP